MDEIDEEVLPEEILDLPAEDREEAIEEMIVVRQEKEDELKTLISNRDSYIEMNVLEEVKANSFTGNVVTMLANQAAKKKIKLRKNAKY